MMSVETLPKDYINKEATQQAEFVKTYPEFDGRGLLIAILDTGVDLSFDGMQKTSTGLPKVIDSFDFTGAGNVDTSVVKTVGSDNVVEGLTGRLLKIPSNWVNPSGEWHLGIKSIYEMCSAAALENIIKKRKETILQQNETLEFDRRNKKNSNAFMEYLKTTKDLSKDSLVADCIVWFNGEKWLACIDTSFIGDLENAKVLTNFNGEYEHGKIMDVLSYSIKIHDNGNLLEIITTSGDHGSYVAQVAAACFQDEPERNALAPGAQIVSMTVMDSRYGNHLNGHALKKAFKKCIEMKVDIINCSFGCPLKNYEDQFTEMTEKHGIIIIFAVGNCGPVYSSIGEDFSSKQNNFIIGSASMKKTKNKITFKVARHSSRGPNFFGDRGVCFIAPGHATLCPPEYSNKKPKLYGGTSLAAPNAAGSIACLLSALKSNFIKYSPSIIKFALSRTTRLPENGNELGYGYGIIQILAAFEFLKSSTFSKLYQSCNQRKKLLEEDKTGILINLDGKNSKNIKEKFTVEILNQLDNAKNVELQLPKNAQNFIRCSGVQNGSFDVELNFESLKPGSITYSEIKGINTEHSGSPFYLPITVIKPAKVIKEENYRIQKDITLNLEDPFRLFILPPEKSCQCIIKMTALEEEISSQVHINHAIEDLDIDRGKEKWFTFNKFAKTHTHYIKVMPKRVHEISFRLKSTDKNLHSAKFNLEVNFYGIHQKRLQFGEKNKNNVLIITNGLEPLTAALTLKFTKVSYNLEPENVNAEKVFHPYDSTLTDYLKLTYFFTITKETKFSFRMSYLKDFPIFRAQVFTESKKFIHGFCTPFEDDLTLLPGKYSIIAYVFCSPQSSDLNNNNYIPPIKSLPIINLSLEFKESITCQINNISSKNKESKNPVNKLIGIGDYKIHFQKIPNEKFENPLPSNIILQGSLNFSNENLNMDIKIKQPYSTNYNSKSSLTQSFKTISLNPKRNGLNCNLAASNPPNNPVPKNLNKTHEEIFQPCRHFLQISNFHAKEINQIEDAIAAGHFGIALLRMNELSTKNQTNPNFKFIDLAIVKLLEHLKWNHLAEAHQNALLDRHRDYYRLL